MNVVRSQIEQTSVEQLRAKHEETLARALATGETPPTFEGDPTFEDVLRKRARAAAAA